jgi:[ribosomal protein S5]-alanine N-acetyltransferase
MYGYFCNNYLSDCTHTKYMQLTPIHIDEDKTKAIYDNADCRRLFESYPDYYHKTGYNPPWIGYMIIHDNKVVGAAGFTGQPKDNRVEIAYGTFKPYEGQGIASFACKELISITQLMDPAIVITAKTAPGENASVTILKHNGFEFTGIVQDDGIGDAWEWVYKK